MPTLNGSTTVDPVAKYLILSYDIAVPRDDGEIGSYIVKTRVYIVPAHGSFPGFGGSSGGLVVGKTPSLIMRLIAPYGTRDIEYDITDKSAWGAINAGLRQAAAEGCGIIHHCGDSL